MTLFAQLWILWIVPLAQCPARIALFAAAEQRKKQNICLMGISMAITHCASNRHTNHVIRVNHGYGLQQKHAIMNIKADQ